MTAIDTYFRGIGHSLVRRTSGWLLLPLLAVSATCAAENVLNEVGFSAAGGGQVDVVLELAGPASDAQVFTTEQPPRIAIDLPDTRSAVEKRRIPVGTGATSSISVVEAAGRTRVVVDLFRNASYDTRVEGNRFIVSIAGGSGAGSAASGSTGASPDPSKRVPASLEVTNIDFRRSPDGAGRVILNFSGDGAAADLRTEGNQVVVELTNVALPSNLAQRLDVTDFATPVDSIEARSWRGGTQVRIDADANSEPLAYQTGQEYVVEIVPRAMAESADATIIGVGQDAPVVYAGQPVTFNFQDIPVRTVLQLIAEESGLNVVVADSVQGNITLRLVNVPWDQALDIILRAKQLDKRREGGVIWVAPQSEIASFEQAKADARIALEQRSPTVTEYIPINYASAEDIAALLTEQAEVGDVGGGGAGGGSQQVSRGFLSARGSVTFDKRTNTLLVNDIPEKIVEIRALVQLLDRPVDQVLIESRIVIATEDFSREIGARFGISGFGTPDDNLVVTSGSLESTTNFTNDLANNVVPPSFLFPDGLNVNMPAQAPNAASAALSILTGDFMIDLELSALEAEGRGETVANPRVITSNQQEAVIKQGDEVGYVTLQQGAGATGNFTVEFKEVVLELRVTPTITQDDRVFLKMNVKKDEVEGFITTPLFSVPQISKREINTSVLVEDGQTVVLGGVYEFRSTEDLAKVPFLGDIPGLGALFRNKLKDQQKAELLIFVTPRILKFAAR
ncbi:MAG TPA: type IV pilus secretin PilQ [Xanthomonadaceae bacterium]|nr:type IV pilus secretin PilQ [Xanthomonadaceae bacterium]